MEPGKSITTLTLLILVECQIKGNISLISIKINEVVKPCVVNN